MNEPFTVGVDVWEGQLDCNEQAFLQGGVGYMLIRINDMQGGHHRDAGFAAQWEQAAPFARIPYFVYNPWVSGAANCDYLRSILPAGVTTVAVDVEVSYEGYPATTYAAQVGACIDRMQAAGMRPIIYTGQWFKPRLSEWPKDVDYWWARYPYALYPASKTAITWQEFREKLTNVMWYPAGTGIIPGPCRLWQCSADRFILPGTGRPIDVNVFNGTLEEFCDYYDLPACQRPNAPSLTLDERVTKLEAWVAAHG